MAVAVANSAFAAERLVIVPGAIHFRTLDDVESLMLLKMDDSGVATADLSEAAAWTVAPADLARIESGPVLIPRKKGEGTLTAVSTNGEKVSVALKVSAEPARRAWSYENHVVPVMTRAGCNSGPCHGAMAGKGGMRLSLRGYAPETDHDVLTRQAGGRRIQPGVPEESLAMWKATGAVPHGGGTRLIAGSRDYGVLADWIAAGAPGMKQGTPKVVRLEASPARARYESGKTGRIVVRAVYSDGSAEDVTGWARFGTTDSTVLAVDDDGRLKAENPGEAHVTVVYANQVTTAAVSVPNPAKVDPALFAKASVVNKIDELNLVKLKALGLPPSPDAGDAAWLRRVTLDLTGQLPDVERLNAFVADADPAKRGKEVERLLATPESIDYWAYQWSDLLLVSSNKLATPAMWAFYGFVRDSVAENKPWDRFVREIVTARGSTLSEGAGNFFAIHRDPTDLTETTSVAFLGLSLTCVRCHNHPMEKWTQDQYYGFASLLGRVGLKDGDATGEVVVSDRPSGEIMHPRRGVPMPPQPLDAPALAQSDPRTRREALADWMTSPENPLFAKAIVNRVWKKFFGSGLVADEDDLKATTPPWDADLLDRLVADFKADGYDMRRLITTIATSAVYARSSVPLPQNRGDTRYLSRFVPRRLSAEVLLDVYSQATDVPTPFDGFPEKWRAMQLPDTKVADGFLRAFGRPERLTTCSCERSNEPSVAQALNLANGESLNQKLRAEKGIVRRWATADMSDEALTDALFLRALSRRPTAAEKANLVASLKASSAQATTEQARKDARTAAVEDLFWAVLTSDEFLFNH
jgi:hypothetical protein